MRSVVQSPVRAIRLGVARPITNPLGPLVSRNDVLALSPITMLDASDASSLTLGDFDRVSQWNDLSGNGNHFTQATGTSQPVFSGKYIDFDGVDDYMTDAGSAASGVYNCMHDGTGGEAFVAYLHDGTPSQGVLWDTGYGSSYVGAYMRTRNTDEVDYATFRGTGGNINLSLSTTNIAPQDTKLVYNARYDATASPIFTLDVNDTIYNTMDFTSATPPVDSNHTYDMNLGAYSNIPSSYHHGRIYAVVWFDRILTTAERNIVKAYFQELMS